MSKGWHIGLVIANFACETDALEFEWAVQHPRASSKFRDAFANRYPLEKKKDEAFTHYVKRRCRRDYPSWKRNMLTLYCDYREHRKQPFLRVFGGLSVKSASKLH